jgi:hypothetical protein
MKAPSLNDSLHTEQPGRALVSFFTDMSNRVLGPLGLAYNNYFEGKSCKKNGAHHWTSSGSEIKIAWTFISVVEYMSLWCGTCA